MGTLPAVLLRHIQPAPNSTACCQTALKHRCTSQLLRPIAIRHSNEVLHPSAKTPSETEPPASYRCSSEPFFTPGTVQRFFFPFPPGRSAPQQHRLHTGPCRAGGSSVRRANGLRGGAARGGSFAGTGAGANQRGARFGGDQWERGGAAPGTRGRAPVRAAPLPGGGA